MAINAYVGTPGSGKTYEVVKSVILPAFLNGRRVVTNIEGISQNNFIDYVDKLNKKRKSNNQIDYLNLGVIIKVNDEDCLKSNFFPYKNATEETIAKNGDLICIDEVWRIFDEKVKIHENHRSFIAEHRHFVNEKGETSDLVVINQSVANIPRFIKDRIESTFKMTKLIALGLNSRYRVDIYDGVKLFKKNLIQSIQEKYDKNIFPLYKSYDGKGKEQRIDNRVNMLKNSGFLFKMIFALLVLILGSIYLLNLNGDLEKELKGDDNTENIIEHQQQTIIKNDYEELNNKNITVNSEDKGLSQKWRIVGYLKKEGSNFVILTDDKNIRYEYLSNFNNDGRLLTGYVDGYRVTFYSGQTHKRENNNDEVRKWLDFEK